MRSAFASIQFEPKMVDMGSVYTGEWRTNAVRVLNQSAAEVDILRVDTSCGCTQTSLSARRLQPGEECMLDVLFHRQSGSRWIQETVTLLTSEGQFRLPVVGTLLSRADLFPATLSVGTLLPGQSMETNVLIRFRERQYMDLSAFRPRLPPGVDCTFSRRGPREVECHLKVGREAMEFEDWKRRNVLLHDSETFPLPPLVLIGKRERDLLIKPPLNLGLVKAAASASASTRVSHRRLGARFRVRSIQATVSWIEAQVVLQRPGEYRVTVQAHFTRTTQRSGRGKDSKPAIPDAFLVLLTNDSLQPQWRIPVEFALQRPTRPCCGTTTNANNGNK